MVLADFVCYKPKWYKLESRKSGKKKSVVSGEVLMQFSIFDPINTAATPQQTINKLMGVAATIAEDDEDIDEDEELKRTESEIQEDEEDDDEDSSDEKDADPGKKESRKERKKRKRLARLKQRAKQRAFEFSGTSDIAGVLFLEIQKITDLPPEKNSMLVNTLITIRYLLTAHSYSYNLRYGSIRCHFARQKNVPHASRQP